MGKALYEESPTARRLLEQADSVLGGDFLPVLFDGPVEKLTATDFSQPAIYSVSCAAYAVFEECAPNCTPAAAAGLSLGEYSALTAAGCLPFADGVALVRQRGQFMQEAANNHPGAMASVLGLDADRVAAVCSSINGAYVANYNSPGQIVVSGEKEAVQKASTACCEEGARRVIALNVSGAFHSPLMEEARARLQPVLDAIEWQAPKYPVLSNVTGLPYNKATEISELLGRQVVESVRWDDNCRWMLLNGIERYYEAGPGKVLQGLMKKIERAAETVSVELPADIAAALQA
jgi:[acyl-carrier-protein] S-malonyltransferase